MRIGRFNLISTSNDILRKKKKPKIYPTHLPPNFPPTLFPPNKTALTVLEHITRTRSYSIPACLAGPVLACLSAVPIVPCYTLVVHPPSSPGLLKWIQTTYIPRGLFRPVLQRQQRPRLLLAPPPPPPPFLLTTQLVEPPVRVLNARTPRPTPSRINPGPRRITRGREL